MELHELIESNADILSSLRFSRELDKAFSEQHILVNIHDVERFYANIANNIHIHTNDSIFIATGLEFIESLLDRGSHTYALKPYATARLILMADRLGLEVPDWMPKIHQKSFTSGIRKFDFYFNWSTVNPEFILKEVSDWIVSFLVEPEKEKRTSKNIQGIEEQSFSAYVAKKYLNKMSDAVDRNLEFEINLVEFYNVLNSNNCYYTGIPLCKPGWVGEPTELPEDYPTIDRIDNSKGYVSGNVVLCSKIANQLKSDASVEILDKILSIRKILSEISLYE